MGKFQAWISTKFRPGEKDKTLNPAPPVQNSTQATYTSTGVQAQIQNPGNDSAQSRRKILKTGNPKRKAEKAIRNHKNNPEDALTWAVHASDYEVASYLLSMPQLHNIKIETYESCLTFAVAHSALICKILVAHAWKTSNSHQRTRLAVVTTATSEVRPEIFDDWLDCIMEEDKILLLRTAVQSNRFATVQWLLKHGTADNGFENVILPLAVKNGSLEMLQLLVSYGADIDAIVQTDTIPGYNALLMAAVNGFVHKVKFLLDHGASISTTDPLGRTPLHLAAKNDHLEVVRLLLDRGASHVAKTKSGEQPIHLAGENGNKDVFNMLREHAGLPPVTRSVHYPHQTATGNESYSPHLSPLCRSGILWPNRVLRDRTTRELYTLEPSDPAYWN